ncbi:hypothetical protein [Actinophytocola gossypii]|uniref:Uncharacterized protein n=1 Tax=Actinophytocola gossypii TaxID=2812003 RepID=A0ABT2J481_9PSEU|nr:hypothetical protein [Actinophytocola gossypii]MCT2582647.1 hypothetical protein [Actinophytocola gossypii]
MNHATAQIHFAIVDDELAVTAPPALAPLVDFFEIEVGTSDAMLDEVEHHVRHDRTWRFTGDACRLRLGVEDVVVEHTHTGASATVPRTEFRGLLADLRAVLAVD